MKGKDIVIKDEIAHVPAIDYELMQLQADLDEATIDMLKWRISKLIEDHTLLVNESDLLDVSDQAVHTYIITCNPSVAMTAKEASKKWEQ